MSNRRIGVVMDPISDISPAKDSTLAMLLESQDRGHEIHYFEQGNLWLKDGEPWGLGRRIEVKDHQEHWFELGDPEDVALTNLDAILMRKDPPFDTEYIYTTYILERAEIREVLIINRPAALRDINEKPSRHGSLIAARLPLSRDPCHNYANLCGSTAESL